MADDLGVATERGSVLPPGLRLAVITGPTNAAGLVFMENLAHNRGRKGNVFEDEAQTLQWLFDG